MSEDNHIPDDLIARCLSGEANPDEMLLLEEWLNASAENRKIYEASKSIWNLNIEPELDRIDTDAAWKNVQSKIKTGTGSRPVIPLYRRFSAVAAMFIFVLTSAGFIYWLNSASEMQTITAMNADERFYLPDSSQVILKAGTKLIYDAEAYSLKMRKVQLQGSALFDVRKSPKRPFVIETAHSQIEVLGTSFEVNEKADSNSTSVTVVTGRVRLSSKSNSSIEKELLPGEEGELLAGNNEITVRRKPIEELRYSLNKTIVFRETRLDIVCSTLQKIFGIEIQMENENLSSCSLTATFRDQELSDIIEIVAGTFSLDFKKNNRGYVLSGNACN